MTERRTQGILWESNGFRITDTGLRINGQPPLGEWASALKAVARAESTYRWAIGDLLVYADAQKFSDEAVEEVMDATKIKRGTLINYRLVSKTFPPGRRTGLPWSHHALVAALEQDVADMLLAQAAEYDWKWEDMRVQAQAARRTRDRVEQKFPEGTYALLLANVPWKSNGGGDTLEKDQITALAPRVQAITAPDAVMYLAASNVQLEDAVEVMRAWGFTLRGHHVIVEPLTQHTTEFMRERHRLLLVGTRGRPMPPEEAPDSVLAPEESVTDVLYRAYGDIPRVALFAAQPDANWVTWQHSITATVLPVRGILVRSEDVAVDVPA